VVTDRQGTDPGLVTNVRRDGRIVRRSVVDVRHYAPSVIFTSADGRRNANAANSYTAKSTPSCAGLSARRVCTPPNSDVNARLSPALDAAGAMFRSATNVTPRGLPVALVTMLSPTGFAGPTFGNSGRPAL